ncbi:TetR/AcrR family transcriptional regulator [Ectothiorhodospiraceae bacterium 2226]|nr:TetR/AcrR family transcriptional regulator [Ectothiorhodospiraceae bacterium 2226]
MFYTKAHKQKSRERILESASRLFAHRGYDSVSIDELMHDAGMTRGAFYNHFEDKAELYADAIMYAATRSPRAAEQAGATSSAASLGAFLNTYLSRAHVEDVETPCPLAFLVTDVGARNGKVRRAYTRVYRSLVRLISKRLGDMRAHDRRDTVMAVTALMIGGVAVGRALDDAQVTERLLRSCRVTARRLLEEIRE